MKWPAERENLLRVLWTQGLSPREIGKRLGVSKSAIISKKDRMGLPDRDASSPTQTKSELARSRGKAPPPVLHIDRSRETGAARGDWNVRFCDKSESQCLMFVGGESRETGLICGREREDGKPYCSECCKLCYEPAEAKRRAA